MGGRVPPDIENRLSAAVDAGGKGGGSWAGWGGDAGREAGAGDTGGGGGGRRRADNDQAANSARCNTGGEGGGVGGSSIGAGCSSAGGGGGNTGRGVVGPRWIPFSGVGDYGVAPVDFKVAIPPSPLTPQVFSRPPRLPLSIHPPPPANPCEHLPPR